MNRKFISKILITASVISAISPFAVLADGDGMNGIKIGLAMPDGNGGTGGVPIDGNSSKNFAFNFGTDNGKKIVEEYTTETGLTGSFANFSRSSVNSAFPDVLPYNWFYSEVMDSAQLGLFKGNTDGTFSPNGNLTYAEAVALASRVHSVYYDNTYVYDIYANKAYTRHWSDNIANYAYEYGIIDEEVLSSPDSACTREQMADLFVYAIMPDIEETNNMFTAGIFNSVNSLSTAPENTDSVPIQTLYKAGIMIGDSKGFRASEPITRAETACILNRLVTPSKRKTASGSTKTATSTKFSTDIPKDPATGKFIPTNDPTMAAYNRPELVNFIYTTMQDAWFEGGVGNYQGLYNTGRSMMADAFGGFVRYEKNMYSNGITVSKKFVSRETYNTLTEKVIGNAPCGTVEDIKAGDYISIPNWVNARMLVAERTSNSVIVIEPTSSSSAVFRWREYTFDQLEVKLGNDDSVIEHLEFKNLQ